MRFCLVLLLLLSDAALASGSGGVNAPQQRDKPYLVLVSIDGFRWDFAELCETPALDRIAAEGVRAERVIPVFPTLTFPNHYSIATGLYPAGHRLIGNRFPNAGMSSWYDRRDRESVQDGHWYGGEPVWVAAEQSGMVTAAFYFVGTEAAVSDTPMTYWKDFDASVPGPDRVRQVIGWLTLPQAARPHLVTLYFEDVDVAAHEYGPGSEQSLASIRRVDGYLDALLRGIDGLPFARDVYVVVVSDHGQMAKRIDDSVLVLENIANLDGLDIVDHGAISFIYFPQPDPDRAASLRAVINSHWQHGRAMLRDETPPAWRVTEEAGFADLIVLAEPGYLVYSRRDLVDRHSRGDHGWAPEAQGMHGYFAARGPGLPAGGKTGPIHAVDVYPLLMKILGLPITRPIDGDPAALGDLLGARSPAVRSTNLTR